jgi:hypothetical protein
MGGAAAIAGILSAAQDVTFTGTGQLTVPAGTTGQRSALPTVGMTRYNRTTNVYESYVGVAGQTISSITFVTTTATLTTSSVHGLSSGDVVTISGASPSNYNGTYSITVTGTSTFTYVMATAPLTNATVVGTYTSGAWQTAITNGTVFSGTYTPTLTNVTNVAASTTGVCQYMRVDSVVTVSGSLSIDPTAATTDTILRMTLPIASDFSATSRSCGGVAASVTSGTYGQSVAILAFSNATGQAEFRARPSVATDQSYAFSFTYRII